MGLINSLLRGDLARVFSILIGVAIALTVHEFAHAKIADWAGDPTPRRQGRVTLNPLAHYDPVGTTLFLLFGIGWGKPVQIDRRFFRHPRRDEVLVSLGGAAANLLVAVLFGLLLRFGVVPRPYGDLAVFIVILNLVLALFNLIPLYPLDGSHVLIGLLPWRAAHRVGLFYARYNIIPLIVLFAAISVLHLPLLTIPVTRIARLLVGPGLGI
jgi:Zn-dependent protease